MIEIKKNRYPERREKKIVPLCSLGVAGGMGKRLYHKIKPLKACVLSHVSLTLCDPMDCSPPVPSVHGILQARILEWVAMHSSSKSSPPRDRTQVFVYLLWQALSLPLAPLLYLMTHKNRFRWQEWGTSTNMCHLLKLPRMLPFPRWRRHMAQISWAVHPRSHPWRHRHQIRSVAQSCPTLCDPMNHSMPGLPVHHQLPEFTETHVHRVSDAIQPSHPLSSPSLPAPNPSQHQSLFQWVNSSHEVAKVLEFQL